MIIRFKEGVDFAGLKVEDLSRLMSHSARYSSLNRSWTESPAKRIGSKGMSREFRLRLPEWSFWLSDTNHYKPKWFSVSERYCEFELFMDFYNMPLAEFVRDREISILYVFQRALVATLGKIDFFRNAIVTAYQVQKGVIEISCVCSDHSVFQADDMITVTNDWKIVLPPNFSLEISRFDADNPDFPVGKPIRTTKSFNLSDNCPSIYVVYHPRLQGSVYLYANPRPENQVFS